MYFSEFPYINYEFPDGMVRNYKNISIRPGIVQEVYGSASNIEEYTVQDGETPETIAYKIYSDVNLHWAIMLANNVMNIYTDWPMSSAQFQSHLQTKYTKQKNQNDSEVEMSETETNEFLEFTGSPSNNFQSINSKGVVLRPHHFEDKNGIEYFGPV